MTMAKTYLIPLVVLTIFASSCSVDSFPVTPLTVMENAGVVTFTISVTPTGSWLLVYETDNDTAFAGVDYTAVVAGGTPLQGLSDTSVDVTVEILDRPGFQGDRVFKLVFTSAINVDLSGITLPDEVSITIEDDDIVPVMLSATSLTTLGEAIGNLTIKLTRTDATDYPFNVTVTTVADSATAMLDFEELDMVQFQFEQDEMMKTITIEIFDDNDAEPSETFNVTIGGDVDTPLELQIEIQDNDTPVPFHCLRKGQDCQLNTQCDFDTGQCGPCEAGYNGADCMDFFANMTVCDPPCEMGSCFDAECKCPPGYTGVACDKEAYYHQCNPTNFSVCITPFGDFMGQVYVIDYGAVAACNLSLISESVPDGVPEWCRGYGAVIEFNGDCGSLGPIAEGNKTVYKVALKVQYNPPDIRGTDEIVTFICSFENESIEISDPTGLSVQPDPDEQGTPNGGTKDFSPAVQTVTLANGDPLPDVLELNRQIKVCVSVKDVPGYDAVLVRGIKMSNMRAVPDLISRSAYEDGCSLNNILFLTPFFEPDLSKHTMCYTFASFILDPTDPEPKLGITTEVQVYENAADTEAELETCGARRKRALTSSGGEVESGYSETVIYLKPQTSNEGDNLVETPQLTEAVCERGWLMPAVIVLGVVAFTMAVIIFILAFTVVKQFRTKRFD